MAKEKPNRQPGNEIAGKSEMQAPGQTDDGGGFVSLTQVSMMSGPIPSPQTLAQYDALVPGAAERIISMAEKQMEHRHHLEKSVVEAGIRDRPRARASTVFISTAFIAAGCYFAHEGYPAYAIGCIGTTLASLAGIYIYGSHRLEKERTDKKKIQSRADKGTDQA